jgi:hypothetical protein
MPTPKAGYKLLDGTPCPGTTTVIGRFKESGGLMQWAFKQGKLGKKHLYEDAEKAADIGTYAHALVEAHIKDATVAVAVPDSFTPKDIEQAKSAFNAYLRWAENFKVRIIAQECLLVSEQYKFGGTPDAVGVVGNQLCLLDWKTSSGIYTDYLIQLAAYKHLWNENNPDNQITGECHLLRFSKENADFSHHSYANLDDAWRQFVLFREAYDIDKALKKRAA